MVSLADIREKKYKDSHKKQISEYNLKWNEANREYTRGNLILNKDIKRIQFIVLYAFSY